MGLFVQQALTKEAGMHRIIEGLRGQVLYLDIAADILP